MLSRYDAAEETQHYISGVKNHYTQLRSQYPELDTGVLFRNLEDVKHRVHLYRAKVQTSLSGHPIEDSGSTSASTSSSKAQTPPPININRGVSGESVQPAAAVQPPDCSQSSSDAPPPYTQRATSPGGDRLAALPPIPAWDSNVVFAPGTFDGYTPEEIIKHYRPQVHRLVLEGLRSQV